MSLCHTVIEATTGTDEYGRFVKNQPATFVVIIPQQQKNQDVIFSSNVSKLIERTANSQTLLI